MKLESLISMLQRMLGASTVTLEVFFLTLIFSLPLGLLVAKGRMSHLKVINVPIKFYLLIMRGTPLILQLIFFYFAPSSLFGISLDRFWAAVLAFSLNYAAYFAEIFRGGIQSIPVGQHEAAAILGLSKLQTFFKIILPQVIKNIIPPMGNEFMTLVKDTALAQTIGVMELFRIANTTSSQYFSTVPIFVAGVFYLAMNAVVSYGFSFASKKLNYYR
ncbi:MAG: amino acid ABC transporter permease [Oscillospiraceae bacterium]|nr:amino acid ABC transporter permease [Oscillospiraceae bacterium]